MSQQLIEPGHVVDAFQQDNKYFIKLYLIDDSVNKNHWGVKSEYIPKHIDKFKGVPIILTPDIFHPHEYNHYVESKDHVANINAYRKMQEPYVIGNIIEVGNNIKQGSLNHEYTALAELTDAKAIEQFKAGRIPLFVSPSIYRLNPQDPNDAIGDYEPIHVAIVDSPAYGVHKANIRGQCEGNHGTCTKLLAQAGTHCVTNTLNNVKNLFVGNSSFTDKTNISNSKVMESQSNNQVSGQDQVTVTTTNPDGSQVVEKKQEVQVQTPENRAPISPPTSPVQEPKNINPPGTEEQREETEEVEDVAKLRNEIKSMKEELVSQINSVKEFKANLEKQSQETQALAKRTKIDTVLPKDYAGSNEAREEAVSKFMNIPDAELEFVLNNFVAPTCSKNVKQAGYKAARVSDFIATKEDNSKNVKQAGTSSKDIEMLNTFLEFGGLSS